MLWFFLWRSEKKERKNLYDCETCIEKSNEWFKNRVCFHPTFGEETYPITVPITDGPKKIIGNKEALFNEEDFLVWLEEFNDEFNPEMPSFEIINTVINPINNSVGKKPICLTSFIDPDLANLVELEDSCHNYHVLPYQGGLFDQPTVLMETFNIIRETKNRYERIKTEKLWDNNKKQSNTNSSSRSR